MLPIVRDHCPPILQTQHCLPTHCRKTPGNLLHSHGNDLHRQWKTAQHLHTLAFIGNADKALCQRGHDFFSCQCSAAALDHVPLAVYFIGAIHIYRQLLNFICVQNLDAKGLQALGAGHRT